MDLNRNDLKKAIYDFNSISNRLMKVDFQEYISVLKKFIHHLKNCNIIFVYIRDCGSPILNIADEISSMENSYNRIYFDLGEFEQQEVSNIYHILKYIVDNNIQIENGVVSGYAKQSSSLQDKIKNFNERVVLVLIRYIEAYLTKIGIDMGMDETIKYSITVNNGQVNLANDNATINAIQNNGINGSELNSILENIKSLSKELSKENREIIDESLEVIATETASEKPKKSMIKMALIALTSINLGTVSATELVKNFDALKLALEVFIG